MTVGCGGSTCVTGSRRMRNDDNKPGTEREKRHNDSGDTLTAARLTETDAAWLHTPGDGARVGHVYGRLGNEIAGPE
ncbi:hypothetical protein RRG08_008741 [Elysia crispata]|uniref:Uncharacterized protein n=1 Tax=Elysia crispata TaxID=231223 RepID=A0AAE0YU42_9GAST|nr:hypothetical protein RRG08_008741 [Elysia crispata]